MDWLEVTAVVIAILGVLYTILENRICWLVNILASLLYLKIFNDSNLPGQALLQLLYVVVGVYGYIHWGADHGVKVKLLGNLLTCLFILASILSGYAIYYLFPGLLWADTALTVGSIVATYLTTKKYLENWTFWIVINLVSIGLFVFRDLKLTAALYLIYAVLSVFGLKQWSKQLVLLKEGHQ